MGDLIGNAIGGYGNIFGQDRGSGTEYSRKPGSASRPEGVGFGSIPGALLAAATADGAAVEKTYGRARLTSQSVNRREPTTNPPA